MAIKTEYKIEVEDMSDVRVYLDDDQLLIRQDQDRIQCSTDNIAELIECLEALQQEANA